ncbi:MAG: riboflavin biosynthesis protein RibF, partial [Flavobacteriaceae bacterium]|nr:riboflavin biosynthesis protein RibF [Flavobacteriaceae bacterium]
FFPHPRMVLQKDTDIKLINTLEEKQQLLEKFDLDNFIVIPFTKDFSRLTSTEFIREILINGLNTKKLVIGYDHHFGRNREGNFEHLKECESLYDFEVEEIHAQDINDVTVSSTKIRKALKNGDILTANKYLGYHFMLTGMVVEGKKLGHTINYPTANIHIEEEYKIIPCNGSYVVNSAINDQLVYGMMNVGYNPTVNGKNKTIEVHFFDFNQNIYNQKIQINLLKRLREEQKFDSIEALKKQLEKDKKSSLDYIKELIHE